MPIRVYIRDMPVLLRDIVTNALTDSDIAASIGTPTPDVLRAYADDKSRAVVLVAGEMDEAREMAQSLMAIENLPAVVALTNNGREVALLQAHVESSPLGELSLTTLTEAVRTAAARKDPHLDNAEQPNA